eukprot:337038-Chlamydomonas_euryale.AAC.7
MECPFNCFWQHLWRDALFMNHTQTTAHEPPVHGKFVGNWKLEDGFVFVFVYRELLALSLAMVVALWRKVGIGMRAQEPAQQGNSEVCVW